MVRFHSRPQGGAGKALKSREEEEESEGHMTEQALGMTNRPLTSS